MTSLTKEFYIMISSIFICLTIIIIIIIMVKNKIRGKIDIKNKTLEINEREDIIKSLNVIVMTRNTYSSRIDEIKKIGKEQEHIKCIIVRRQMIYAKRKIQILIGEIIERIVEILNLEEGKPPHFQFVQYYTIVEYLLIDEVRRILKRNHLLEIDDWNEYCIDTQKYVFEVIEEHATKNYYPDMTGINRKEYNEKCKRVIKELHKKYIIDILFNAKEIVNRYQKKICLLDKKIEKIKAEDIKNAK